MTAKIVLLIVAGIAIAYPVIMRVLADRAQGTRLKMAETARRLIGSHQLTQEQKLLIVRMTRDAFEWRIPVFAAIAVPLFIVAVFRGQAEHNTLASVPPALRDDVKKFISYFLRSMFAANPLFSIVSVVEFCVFGAPAFAIADRLAKVRNDDSHSNLIRRKQRGAVLYVEEQAYRRFKQAA